MKYLKENPLVLKNQIIKFTSISIILIHIFSCAHSFKKIGSQMRGEITKQVLKVKVHHDEGQERLTIYSQIDRKNQYAIFEGTSRFGKHVFTLEVRDNNYTYSNYIDDTTVSGTLTTFEPFPLNKKIIFSKIDIKKTQPIVLFNPEKNIKVKITVKSQENLNIGGQ